MASYSETIVQTLVDELTAVGFDTRVELLANSDLPWVLAENANFLVGAVVAESFAQLTSIEPDAVLALLERVEGASAGAKVWDAYLLLICPDVLRTSDEIETAATIAESLRGVRRIVATEVTVQSDVRRALSPFLPLPKPSDEFEVSAL